jgi:hypothetical protein
MHTETLIRVFRRVATASLLPAVLLCARGASAQSALSYHGGAVIGSPAVRVIFWVPEGRHLERPGHGNDRRFISLISQFFGDLGGSSYYGVLLQYSLDTSHHVVTGGPLKRRVAFDGAYLDTTAYPHAGTKADPLPDTALPVEIRRVMAAAHWPATPNTIVLLFTAADTVLCEGQYSASCDSGFAAWHDSMSMPGRGAMPYIWVGTTRCVDCNAAGRSSATITPNGDWSADLAVGAGAHELLEAITDPFNSAWKGPRGIEIMDLCESYARTTLRLNTHQYWLPLIWSARDGGCVSRLGGA